MPADTRKDEIEGLFSGMVEQAAAGKKLICCWPPPGHSLEEDAILNGRRDLAKRVFQAFSAVIKTLPGS